MSLYSDLNEVLTPYAQRIKGLLADISNKADKPTTYTKTEVDDALGEIQDDLKEVVCINLMGNEPNVLYPVTIPSGGYFTVSTSDGSVFPTDSTLQVQLLKEDKTQSDYFTLKNEAASRTIHTSTSKPTTYYLRFNEVPSVPLMVNYGSTPLTYQEYFPSIRNGVEQNTADLGNKNVLKTSEKTSVVSAINSFLQVGKNLYNPYGKTEGYYVSTVNGDLSAAASQNVSDYISVAPNTAYTISWETASNQCRYAFYSSNKAFIANSGGKTASSVTSVTLTSPDTGAFLRFSNTASIRNWQVEKGDTATPYEPYTLTFDDGFVWSDGVVERVDGVIDAHNFSIKPEDTTFFHVSKNMIDPSVCVNGEYVNQVNGAFASSSNHKRTGYIKVEPNTTYVIRNVTGVVGSNFRYAFYRDNKTYISGAVGAISDMLLTSPANARYIAISDDSNMASHMIAVYADNDKSFEYYDSTHILRKYIQTNLDGITLNVPSKIYALVGYETNIYFDNIIEDWEKYKWDVTCSKGMQLERGYRITPVSDDVGTYSITIRASIGESNYIETTSTIVITADTAGNGDSTSVIILGDSTTYNGIMVTKLNDNFSGDVMSLFTLGTMGTAPNSHEGRSGWRLSDYFTKASITYPSPDPRGTINNPFYNPTSQTWDADYYFTNSGVSTPDWFFINMGINDVFSYTADGNLNAQIETCIGYLDDMITSLKSAVSGIKIGICLTIPPNHSQDSFGKAYGCGQTRDRYKRNNYLWVKRLISEYDGRELDSIYVIPIHANLDTIYNMGMETLPINARNTAITYQSPIANGGVHPVESGYWQIADVYAAFLKAQA